MSYGTMYSGGLGQPALPSEVLSMQLNPQMSPEWADWVGYWWTRMDAANTLSEVARVRSLAEADLDQQGASPELLLNQPGLPYGFANAVLDGMVNTAALRFGYKSGATSSDDLYSATPPSTRPTYTPTTVVNFEKVYAERGQLEILLWKQRNGFEDVASMSAVQDRIRELDAILEPYGAPVPHTQQSLDSLYRMLLDIEAALPELQRQAEIGGYPGAKETYDAWARTARDARSTLQLDRSEYSQYIPKIDPDFPTGPEAYVIDGIRIEVPAGTGAQRATEMVRGGCIDSEIISCSSTTGEPVAGGVPSTVTSDVVNVAGMQVPAGLLIAGGLALLLIPGKKKRQ